MTNTSSSGSNDEYPTNNDSNWTTPDLDPVWLLPEEDLNAMLAAADQLQVDINSNPAIANTVSNDIVDPFGGDAFADQEMLALLQDPQMLVYAQHAFDDNLVGSTSGGHTPPHAHYALQGMPPTRNVRGALASSVNRATIAPTGQQLDTTLPRFVDDNRGGHLAPNHAGVQHAGAVPYYNGPPQGAELPFGRQGDWTGLPTQNFDNPANAYQQWGYGTGPVQQFGLGNANLQLPPPPPPTYGPTTQSFASGLRRATLAASPASFHAGQGTRAPLTFAETVNAMGFEAWAAQPPPRSVGFPNRGRTRGRTGQRGRREPGAPAQTPATLPGPSQSGTARGTPVADVPLPPAGRGRLGFPPHVPSAPSPAQELWMAQPNGMPAPPDFYGAMGAFDPAVHGRQTLAAARTVRDNDAPQRPGTSRPGADSALEGADTSQAAPRRQRPHPPSASDGSSSQAATAHGAPMPAPDESPAVPPVKSKSAAPRARGKKRARTDEEQLEPAPRKRKKARSALPTGPSTTQGQAPEEPSERDPDRFRQFCARVGASPGETPGAGPSNLGHNVQTNHNFVAHSGTQENHGEVEKIRVWDGPESARPTPIKGRRYPLDEPRPKRHDWYCRVCRDDGVHHLYWQTVPKAKLHVKREHPEDGEPRHVVERGKGSGTKRKKQPPKDEEKREEDKDKEGKE